MNNKAKKRLVIGALIILMAMLIIVANLGSGGSSTSLEVGEVVAGDYQDKKVQVTGKVVPGSYRAEGTSAFFTVVGEEGQNDTTTQLDVIYDGALPATFGDEVIAICTGTMKDGTLYATDLVTKCPSKYESAEGALTVANLKNQSATMVGVETKVAGYIVQGTLVAASGDGPRFEIESQDESIKVNYDGALSTEFQDRTAVVLTGSLQEDGSFTATEVAIDTDVAQ